MCQLHTLHNVIILQYISSIFTQLKLQIKCQSQELNTNSKARQRMESQMLRLVRIPPNSYWYPHGIKK